MGVYKHLVNVPLLLSIFAKQRDYLCLLGWNRDDNNVIRAHRLNLNLGSYNDIMSAIVYTDATWVRLIVLSISRRRFEVYKTDTKLFATSSLYAFCHRCPLHLGSKNEVFETFEKLCDTSNYYYIDIMKTLYNHHSTIIMNMYLL